MESNKIVTSIKWASIQFAIETFFRFSIRLILAKLLLPNEFGLVGMSTVFISVAGAASELGMSAALIQKKNDSDAQKMYSTSFWSGIVWGIFVFSIMIFIVGPFAAYFYDEPLLIKLVPILSLGILLKPLSMIHTVILTRSMNFKYLAKVNNTAVLFAGIISILAAYFNFGVWSLAINNILSVVLSIPLLFFATKWKPIFEWNMNHFKEIFRFGAYSTGTGIFGMITYNIDNLMIGKMLGSSVLGNYTLAFSLTEQLRQVVSNVLNKVMYPVFGKIQDEKAQLKNYFLKIVNINSILMFPLMMYFILFSKQIIISFFGLEWKQTIIPLQILSGAMMVHLLVNSFTSLIRGIGKPKLEMRIIIGLTLFVLLPSLFVGIKYFGIVGATLAILINKIMLVIIGLIVLKKEIGLSFLDVLKSINSALIGIILSSLIVFCLKFFNISNFFLISGLYGLTYFLVIFKCEKENLSKLISNLT